ncbi:MAG TPA: LLM class flavin-dependent oxidoreductase [Candidatus Binataceae bacterium]|nr:LLM class flavin-dependent oxidoreductase [Candidatus Binataceae bacterium]
MEFGLFLATIDFAAVRDSARAAEELGYHLVVFPDHFVHQQPGGGYDAHAIAHDAILLAAAAAQATRTIRIGHLVLCNLFRHPAVTAQALMSLDHLSGGRLVAGLGAGWTETEFRMTGIGFPDIATRLRMLDESLICIRSLWTQERTSFEGEFYRLNDAILWPKPLQQPHPPIIIGGSGRGALRLMAKHADVANIAVDTGKPAKLTLDGMGKITDAAFRDRANFVRAEAARLGRDPNTITISNAVFSVMLADSPAAAEVSAREIGQMFGIPAHEAPRSALFLIGTPQQCVEELQRRAAEWGVGQFLFAAGSAETTRRLANEVLRHVGR